VTDRRRLDISKILAILPHRYPMLMIDRVTQVVEGERIVARKMVSAGEPWCSGHFPSSPLFPGMLILECMAQAGALLVYTTEPFDPNLNVMYYLGLDKVKFRNTVAPGDQLDVVVEVVDHRASVWRFRAEATVDGTLCAQAELMASVVDRA